MQLGWLLRIIAPVFVLTMLSPSFSFAQKDAGTILGYVGDEHGAPLAGAKVTLTSDDAKYASPMRAAAIKTKVNKLLLIREPRCGV